MRKVWDKISTLCDERIYLGAYEIFRNSTNGDIDTERQTVHVMDDVRRIAMVETLTIDGGDPVTTPAPRQRYQLSNQIESASVELTEDGAIISYEEYFPFGATSFHSAAGSIDVSAKRYRYTGKERDEETAFYYHGARYYAPWLGRWTAADPKTLAGGSSDLNGFAYVRGNPIRLHDPNGLDDAPHHGGVALQTTAPRNVPVAKWGSASIDWKEVLKPAEASQQSVQQSGGTTVGTGATTPSGRRPTVKQLQEQRAEAGMLGFENKLVELIGLAKKGGGPIIGPPSALPGSPEHQEREIQENYEAGENLATTVFVGVAALKMLGGEGFNLAQKASQDFLKGAAGRLFAGAEGRFTAAIGRLVGSKELETAANSARVELAAAPKSRDFVPDLSHVTGKTAQVRAAVIEHLSSQELSGVRLTHVPEYNPFLEPFGIAKEGVGSQLGPLAFQSRANTVETIVHEELHHRWWARGIVDHHAIPELDARFEAVVQRFLRMKGVR